jgi:hypothetical protein
MEALTGEASSRMTHGLSVRIGFSMTTNDSEVVRPSIGRAALAASFNIQHAFENEVIIVAFDSCSICRC